MPSKLTVLLVSLLLATPAVAFWLWLVFVPAKVAVQCPEGCDCESGSYFIVCKFLSVNPIPLIHVINVQNLWFYENNITLLEKDYFVSMTELENLRVYNCGLRTIEFGAFNGLTVLSDLRIMYNNLSEIIPGTFENLSSLEHLDLRHNYLKRLDCAVFSGLVKLKHLILTGNQLQYLHPHTFFGLPKISSLYIAKNVALQIPTDRDFINSHSLSQLESASCNISSLSVETFANISALKLLDLSYNNLKTVDINILRALPELSELYLYRNALQCDCQLQEVWRWCEDRNIQTVDWRGVPECDTPSGVKGMGWGVLQKGQCLDGNIQYFGDYNSTSYSDTDIEDQKYEYEYLYVNDD